MSAVAALVSFAFATACATHSAAAPSRPLTAAAPSATAQGAPATKPAAAKAQGDSAMICTMERPTGSNIPEKVCRPANEVEWDRLRAQEFLLAPRNSPTNR